MNEPVAFAAVSAALLLGATACGHRAATTTSKPVAASVAGTSSHETTPRRSPDAQPTWVINWRQYRYMTHARPYCRHNPNVDVCQDRFVLQVHNKAGEYRLVYVSRDVFGRCHLHAHYPTCANRGQR